MFCLLQGLGMEQASLFSLFASPSTQAAAQAQDHIGWSNLLLGQLTAEWSSLQCYHLTSISSHQTSTSWAIGIVTYLLAIFHSLWVFCNQVVHDWTVDGLAHAAELHISEELHTQFALGLQDLPAIYQTPLHQRTLCGLPPACSSHELPMMACSHCHCPSNRPSAMPSRDPIYASCTPYLPSPPSTTP